MGRGNLRHDRGRTAPATADGHVDPAAGIGVCSCEMTGLRSMPTQDQDKPEERKR